MKKKWYWIIGIASFLLILYFVYFLFFGAISSTPPSPTIVKLENAKNDACRTLLEIYNCTDTTKIITNNFDSNKDGKIDVNDTLFELCKTWYGCEDETCCKEGVCDCY